MAAEVDGNPVVMPALTPASPSQDGLLSGSAPTSATALPATTTNEETPAEIEPPKGKKINFKKYLIPMWGVVADLRRRIPWYLYDIKVCKL